MNWLTATSGHEVDGCCSVVCVCVCACGCCGDTRKSGIDSGIESGPSSGSSPSSPGPRNETWLSTVAVEPPSLAKAVLRRAAAYSVAGLMTWLSCTPDPDSMSLSPATSPLPPSTSTSTSILTSTSTLLLPRTTPSRGLFRWSGSSDLAVAYVQDRLFCRHRPHAG